MIDRLKLHQYLNETVQADSMEPVRHDEDPEPVSSADMEVSLNGVKIKASGWYTIVFSLIGSVLLYFTTL